VRHARGTAKLAGARTPRLNRALGFSGSSDKMRVRTQLLEHFTLSWLPCLALVILAVALITMIPFETFVRADDASSDTSCKKDETKTDEGCVKNPRVIQKVEPSYPHQAWKARAEGSVTLSARVNTKGHIEDAKVVSSRATDNTYLSSFEEAALAALPHWRYRPATLEGKPVPMYFEVTIDFHMSH
jgi:TonB family protein